MDTNRHVVRVVTDWTDKGIKVETPITGVAKGMAALSLMMAGR